MSSRLMHGLRLFLVPGLPVAAAAVALGLVLAPRSSSVFTATAVLVVAVGVGLVLAWRFNQSRTVFALLLVLALDRFWVYAFGTSESFWVHVAAVAALSTLPALNLVAISLSRERGVLTRYGLIRVAVLAAEAAALAVLVRLTPRTLYSYVTMDIIPPALVAWMRMPQPALLVVLATLTFFLVRFLHATRAEDAGFFWATLTLAAPLLVPTAAPLLTVYSAGAAVLLVAYVLESSHSMAFRDTLTGLPGRRAFENELPKLGNRYAIAIADIDYFKTFNDTYGHDVGDQVLRMVAGHLAHVGGGARAYRYGGEEFTLLFPRRNVEDAHSVVERLRRSIDEASFTLRRRDRPEKPPREKPQRSPRRFTQLSVTVSIGVAGKNGARTSPDEVIRAADEALYSAKRAGRNRVSVAK
jgi:diguanylate cyclase (GGDEF)-like protein